MKNPSLNGWLAIIGALAAAVITICAALSDRTITEEEAQTITEKTGALIETIKTESAE